MELLMPLGRGNLRVERQPKRNCKLLLHLVNTNKM